MLAAQANLVCALRGAALRCRQFHHLRSCPCLEGSWEGSMQRIRWFALAAMLFCAANLAVAQQIGKYVPIQAGSEVDHALNEIKAAADPGQKLALIEKFAEGPGKDGDYPLVADGLFVDYYLGQKNYDKAFEYGDKLFA